MLLGGDPAVTSKVLRLGADLSWRAHMQPTRPGWVDLAVETPIMDTSRPAPLGWLSSRRGRRPRRCVSCWTGFADRSFGPTPALARNGWRAPGISAVTSQVPAS